MSTHILPERNDFAPLALVVRVWSGDSDQESSAPIGAGIRIGLSVGALCTCLAAVFMFVGAIEVASGRVADEFVAMSIAVAGMGWCILLYRIWANYRNWRRPLRAALICVITWVLAGGMMALMDAISHRAEFLIGAIALLAAGITIANITHAIWDHKRAKAMAAPEIPLRINCPACGYSMSGLDNCTCPECGRKFTLDSLMKAQNSIPKELRRVEIEVQSTSAQTALPPTATLAT